MTAFLFISPTIADPRLARRVDFGNIASLFGDGDEPASQLRRKMPVARFALIALVTIGIVGDALLVARPGLVASCTASPSSGSLAKGATF